MKPAEAVTDRFRAWHQEAWQDKAWAEATTRRIEHREKVRKEILLLLDAFTTGGVTLSELKATFDRKTRKEWDGFGLKAMSGAMFLNMMTLHVPEEAGLCTRLRQVLPAPTNESEGRQKMGGFYTYLNETLARHNIPLRKLQPRCTPFFLSAWWHLRDQESWPIFYESARLVLSNEGLLEESGEPVQDYFRFRSAWLELRAALNLGAWDLELLCARIAKPPPPPIPPAPEPGPVPAPAPEVPGDEPAKDSAHVEVQWILAQLGLKLGCKIWIAANDHGRERDGQKLESLSIPSLPNLGMGEDAQKIVDLIDVIWLKAGKQVVAAFEVESTTSIYSGLLRMADLITTCPNLNISCFIVVPQNRVASVRRQLSRPTFQSIGLNNRCGFFSIETLKDHCSAMMKWAKDPGSIRELATFVEDTSE